jgi:TIR domain
VSAPIFISYCSIDEKIATTICDALQSRGYPCWISCRNVNPGENFQEAIVKAIRSAKLMILIFTSNANNSDEIKKEVVLAGRHRITVVPVRVEDVVPNDALAYEFATRQWIDLLKDWEDHIEQLTLQIGNILTDGVARGGGGGEIEAEPHRQASVKNPALRLVFLLSGLVVVALGLGGTYLYMRPAMSPRSPAAPPAASSPLPARQVATDESEWLDAASAGTISSFNAYLKAFPDGAHAAQAQQRIADLEAPPTSQPPKTLDAQRFDGLWRVKQSCPKTATALGFNNEFVARVKDAHLHAQNGIEGKPASMTLDGKIEPDGSATLIASGLTGMPAYNQQNLASGMPFAYQVATRFDGSSGVAAVVLPLGRPCDFTFTKE